MKIALIALEDDKIPFEGEILVDTIRFPSVDSMLQESDLQGIVLGQAEEKLLEQVVLQILGDPGHGLLPLFICAEIPMALAGLVEPGGTDFRKIRARVGEIGPLLKILGRLPEEADYEERLLRWLFVRPEGIVSPVADFKGPQLYTYHLLEALHPEPSKTKTWISSLVGRGLLTEKGIVDRVRLCPGCGQGHLNFVDRCPNCQSIDIRKHDFLHCFACGNVSPEADFLIGNHLSCPKCRAQLRHIGAEYDRPLENQRCHSCGTVFLDSEVVARCLDCNRVSVPGDLETVNISHLSLTEDGRLAVRNGTLRDVYAVFDREHFATRKHFEQLLGWIRDMFRRYGSPSFSLVRISVRNVPDLVAQIGRPSTIILLEEFSRRLRAIMRDTDIPLRLEEHAIVILMPATSREKALVGIKRLGVLSGESELPGRDKLQVDYGLLAVPEDSDGKESPAILLGMLNDRVTGTL